MKAFIVKILFISVFFIGLGAMVEKVGLWLKSIENEPSSFRVVRIEAAEKTIVRQVYFENSDDCQIKLGPIFPLHSEPENTQ